MRVRECTIHVLWNSCGELYLAIVRFQSDRPSCFELWDSENGVEAGGELASSTIVSLTYVTTVGEEGWIDIEIVEGRKSNW